MSAIKFCDLQKIYKEGFWGKSRVGLEGISFSVPQGMIFGFLGANGAGKTTAIKIALGLQSATSGSVEIFGKADHGVETKARLGYLPERPYLHQNLTAEEFLNFHRSLYGNTGRGRALKTNVELLKMVGLAEARYVYLRNFSKGMLQRVGLAQSLINDPELVILDEPMSGLDPVGRREVRNLLLELNRSGKTIFFSSHILSDIESLCEQIAFLEKGKLQYCGAIDRLISMGKNEFEVLFRGGKAPTDSGLIIGLIDVGEMKKATVVGEASARKVAEALWASGAEIRSIVPVHRNLEDVLFGEGGLKS